MSKDLKKENIQEETTKLADESQSKWKIPRIRLFSIISLIIAIVMYVLVFFLSLLLIKERGDDVQRVMILLPCVRNIVVVPLLFLLYEIGISIVEYIKFRRTDENENEKLSENKEE